MGQKSSKSSQLNNQSHLDALTLWSSLQNQTIIFDSDVDGDGSQNTLRNALIHKKNVYLILFDNQDNVFGGYSSTEITVNKKEVSNSEENFFIFSMKRNGVTTNVKYLLKSGEGVNAFGLLSNNCVGLFTFGVVDIAACKVGFNKSFCCPSSYDYKNLANPLTESYPNEFCINRLIVIQMS